MADPAEATRRISMTSTGEECQVDGYTEELLPLGWMPVTVRYSRIDRGHRSSTVHTVIELILNLFFGSI